MELLWFDIREMSDAEYEKYFSMLSKDRKDEVSQFMHDEDRRRTVAAEMLVRQSMAERMAIAPEKVPLIRDSNGKPVIENCPVYFSVSHSGPYAVCAVCDHPIGVDIEVIRSSQAKFIQRVCSEKELQYIRLGNAGDLQRFWEMWTAKEALFKLTGNGPLTKLSSLELPPHVAVDYIYKNNCALSIAVSLK